MKKFYLLSLILLSFVFIPLVKADNPYSVVMVSNTSNNKVIGTYSSYSQAVSVMNSQNSTSTSVASIYKNGKIINSRYAVFQFNSNNSTINLYQNEGDWIKYTYTSPSSMTDTAFITSNESRVQIMLNGFKGWADINTGNIIPISLLGSNAVNITAVGLNFRSEPSTNSSILAGITCTNSLFTYTEKTTSGGRVWYKINYNGTYGWIAAGEWLTETTTAALNTYYYRYSSGNLLHRYAYHNGSSYSDYFTNLGPTPSYLTEGVHYYSFDGGIYLYSTLTSMLDDYRNNTYTSSINANNPNYPYYMYLPNRSVSKITADELNSQITNTNSKLYGQGVYFKEAESLYGMNALSAFATAKNESASGTSTIALNKNNVFGYGAYDSCPYDCAKSYSSVRDSIMDYAKNGLSSYMTAEANYYFGTHAGNKGSGRNVMYASDPLWGETQASFAYQTDKKQNMRDYMANTIAVTKYGKYNVPVYDKDGNVIYHLQNKNSSLKVYNVPVTVIEKSGDYYKIYSDNSSYQYGYVKISDFNINNNAPTINASDRQININSNFNYLEGVSAFDIENGNLNVTYTGEVNTAVAGEYKVTYKATDSSNLTNTKTITITVIGDTAPIIEASDKEVSQYTTFNYLEEVSAFDAIDGNLNVTYIGEVNTDVLGKYNVTYSATNSKNKTTTKTIAVTVVDNEKPVINASDKTIYLNKDFDALDAVSAFDKEDGDITNLLTVVNNNVDTSKIGQYTVEYRVLDSANQETIKSITVNVEEKNLSKADGIFYLDYLKEVDNNLVLKGYNTILGIDNNLNNDIKYSIIFENVDTKETIIQQASRITDTSEITKSIYSLDGYDYSNPWFKLNIDFSNLNNGNYIMYIVAESEDYYSKNIVNNKLNKTIDGGFETSDKSVILRRNYSYKNSPVEIIVRNKTFTKKTAGSYYNQFDKYTKFEFKDNLLHLKGVSYSYGANLSTSVNVNRSIIFENMTTYDKYTMNLGYIDNGDYLPVLPENDNLDKTRSWYDANIDISNIPVGDYVIYITTTSNITDIYEFTEKMGRKLDSVRTNLNGKHYSFTINYNKGNRIEMHVENE